MVGDEAIRESFAKVKRDFAEQDKRISQLKGELSELRNKVFEFLPRLLEQNNKILKRLEVLEQSMLKKDPLKKQLITKYKRGRREVVKQKILELINLRELTLPQLREIVVEEQGYCSRATFYRYLYELRKEKLIEIVTINGIQSPVSLSQIPSH